MILARIWPGILECQFPHVRFAFERPSEPIFERSSERRKTSFPNLLVFFTSGEIIRVKLHQLCKVHITWDARSKISLETPAISCDFPIQSVWRLAVVLLQHGYEPQHCGAGNALCRECGSKVSDLGDDR